ncbi:MAG: esterase, partial [Dehalococcoidia bacterium]|nr:esterase [Dehalococcoidia bacterium]
MLSADGNQFWHQSSANVLDVIDPGDEFGSSLAAGDFNDDGEVDLAVGVAREDVETVADAGAVNVLYGTGAGLAAAGNQLWHQGSPGIEALEAADFFGNALAAGDFNGDGADDLVVGVANEDLPGAPDAGAVNVIYGSSGGLTSAGAQFWHQDIPGVLAVA